MKHVQEPYTMEAELKDKHTYLHTIEADSATANVKADCCNK